LACLASAADGRLSARAPCDRRCPPTPLFDRASFTADPAAPTECPGHNDAGHEPHLPDGRRPVAVQTEPQRAPRGTHRQSERWVRIRRARHLVHRPPTPCRGRDRRLQPLALRPLPAR
jgi:hypothetical protein